MKKAFLLVQSLLVVFAIACGAPEQTSPQGTQETLAGQDSGLTLQNCVALTPTSVLASGDDGDVPQNTLDDRLDTRWSNLGKGSWIDYDLGSNKAVLAVAIAWHQGDTRANTFTVSSSLDGINYTPLYSGKSTGLTTAAETYVFSATTTRRVRITVQGNTVNDWASIAEARVCAAPTASTVVWHADFETGDLSQWDKAQMVSADRLQVVSSTRRLGSYALKATVKQGDDPINASGNRNELVKMTHEASGSEYYYGWSTQFASDYPSAKAWQVFTQWHHEGSDGSPPVEFDVYGEQIQLNIGGNAPVTVWSTPLVRGQWLDFVFHVKWSADASVGFVELYVNGKLVLPKRQIATMYPGMLNYLKMGLYRSDTIKPDGVVYHDNWVMGRSLADVLY